MAGSQALKTDRVSMSRGQEGLSKQKTVWAKNGRWGSSGNQGGGLQWRDCEAELKQGRWRQWGRGHCPGWPGSLVERS